MDIWFLAFYWFIFSALDLTYKGAVLGLFFFRYGMHQLFIPILVKDTEYDFQVLLTLNYRAFVLTVCF